MPPTDSSSSPAAPLASIGRSIRSLRRDHNQIHSFHAAGDSDLDAADAFQRRAAGLLTDLLADGPPDLLSLAWTTRLLDAFLLCLEDFRALLFGPGAAAAARPPLDRLVTDFFDCAVKALDLCNAVRDGLDLVRQWRNHLAIAAAVLSAPVAPLGEAQIRRPQVQGHHRRSSSGPCRGASPGPGPRCASCRPSPEAYRCPARTRERGGVER